MKFERCDPLHLAAILAIALLAACAESKTGSSGTGSVPAEREPVLVAGTLVGAEPFSVGVREIETGAASIRKDEDAGAGAATLRLGMNFEGAGTVMPLDGTPVALREGAAQSAARGPVASLDASANRFTVATLTVIVDANTLYDGAAGIAALAPGTQVEVAGLPLADLSTVLATRVTLVPANAAASIRARSSEFAPVANTRVELEGIALDVTAGGAFVLRTPSRDYDVVPGGTAPVAVTSGARVRVVGTASSPTSLTPASMTVITGQIAYRVTGAVSEFSSLAALRVRGEPVDLTTAVIRGGNASDIANGRRLAIVGTAGAGVLRASEATLLP